MFKKVELLKDLLVYFKDDEMAASIWVDKYALKDHLENIFEKDPNEMHWRIAKELARIEQNYPNSINEQDIFNLLKQFKYLVPQGGLMAGIGNTLQFSSLSNCFVVGNQYDSYSGIFRVDQDIAQLEKRRAGVGIDISPLRPKGAKVNNSALTSTGADSFAPRFSNTTREVAQEGRRGALMISISIKHPDAESFIDLKMEKGAVTGANISVRVDDEFMGAVEHDTDYFQYFPTNANIEQLDKIRKYLSNSIIPYDQLIEIENGLYFKKVKAKRLWDKIIHNVWFSAEPGVLFWDKIISESPADCYSSDGFGSTTTNPSLRGSTKLLTNMGVFEIQDLEGSIAKLYTIEGEFKDALIQKTSDKERLIKISLPNYQSVYCTDEHKWPVYSFYDKEIVKKRPFKIDYQSEKELKDKIVWPIIKAPYVDKNCPYTEVDGYMLGMFYKTGRIFFHITDERDHIKFYFNDKDIANKNPEKLLDYIYDISGKRFESKYPNFILEEEKTINMLKKMGMKKDEEFPISLWFSDMTFVKGFIDGLFSCGDTIYFFGKDRQVQTHIIISNFEFEFVQEFQKFIAFFGIRADYRKSDTASVNKYDIVIYSPKNVYIFSKTFSFSDADLQDNLSGIDEIYKEYKEINPLKFTSGEGYTHQTIVNVEYTEEFEPVYDATILEEGSSATYLTEFGFTGNCVVYETPILTDKGYIKIGEYEGQYVNIWNGTEFSNVLIRKTGIDREILDIEFSNGIKVGFTHYHKFILFNGCEIETKDLNIGDRIINPSFPIIEGLKRDQFKEKEAYTQGFYCGDGVFRKRKFGGNASILIYKNKVDLNNFKYFYKLEESGNFKKPRIRLILIDEYNYLNTWVKDKYFIPNISYSINDRLNWLAGLMDADGSLNDKRGSISISQSNYDFLLQVKFMLNTLGVDGNIILDREAGYRLLPTNKIKGEKKEYWCKTQYRLIINSSNIISLYKLGLKTFRVKIDFNCSEKNNKYRKLYIKGINKRENLHDTFCFTEPKEHKGIFSGILTKQCGEIPLCPYDSCRLLAINLYNYVDHPFVPFKAKFNFALFKKHVQIAQRLMDDVVDLEIEKVKNIIEKIKKDPEDEVTKMLELSLWKNILEKAVQGRRTGLGVTAEGDMLAALGLQYGSEKAIEFSIKVHKTLATEAYSASIQLAQERGCFPIWALVKEKTNPFINRIFDHLSVKDKETYIVSGRRNIAVLTIAPTGTTSIMTQTTSGIEPVFLPVYKRRRKSIGDSKKIVFTDEVGDKWEEYIVIHHKFIDWYQVSDFNVEKFNYLKCKKYLESLDDKMLDVVVQHSPYFKSTSNDVDWVAKVKMQGEIQKWVDHSISVTVNVPKETTEEKISEIYLSAWKFGCKGVTLYRDGSRTGILVSNTPTNYNKRPPIIDCDIIRFQNNKEKWIAFVGIHNDKPYEIFTGPMVEERLVAMPKSKNVVGKISKIREEDGKSRYDFIGRDYSEKELIVEGINKCFNLEFHNYAKLISGLLRHGMPLPYLIHVINKMELGEEEGIHTWKAGVIRALTPYIENGSKAHKEKCDSCGSDNLVYQEGCLICNDCGSGKCG